MNERIHLEVTNERLQVENMRIIGVGSASLVLIGDTETVQLSSAFDTPAESLIITPLVPFNA